MSASISIIIAAAIPSIIGFISTCVSLKYQKNNDNTKNITKKNLLRHNIFNINEIINNYNGLIYNDLENNILINFLKKRYKFIKINLKKMLCDTNLKIYSSDELLLLINNFIYNKDFFIDINDKQYYKKLHIDVLKNIKKFDLNYFNKYKLFIQITISSMDFTNYQKILIFFNFYLIYFNIFLENLNNIIENCDIYKNNFDNKYVNNEKNKKILNLIKIILRKENKHDINKLILKMNDKGDITFIHDIDILEYKPINLINKNIIGFIHHDHYNEYNNFIKDNLKKKIEHKLILKNSIINVLSYKYEKFSSIFLFKN